MCACGRGQCPAPDHPALQQVCDSGASGDDRSIPFILSSLKAGEDPSKPVSSGEHPVTHCSSFSGVITSARRHATVGRESRPLAAAPVKTAPAGGQSRAPAANRYGTETHVPPSWPPPGGSPRAVGRWVGRDRAKSAPASAVSSRQLVRAQRSIDSG